MIEKTKYTLYKVGKFCKGERIKQQLLIIYYLL